jgi:hypothetical protein
MASTEHPEMSLVVTAMNREGPQMINLQSGSGAATRPVWPAIFALIGSSLLDALSDFRKNVTRLGFSV